MNRRSLPSCAHKRGWSLFGILLILLGLGMLGLAFQSASKTYAITTGSEEVDGRVTVVGFYGLRPQIEFVTLADQHIAAPEGIVPGYHAGDRITVIYAPDDPVNRHRISSLRALWGETAFFVIFGLIFVFAGLRSGEQL